VEEGGGVGGGRDELGAAPHHAGRVDGCLELLHRQRHQGLRPTLPALFKFTAEEFKLSVPGLQQFIVCSKEIVFAACSRFVVVAWRVVSMAWGWGAMGCVRHGGIAARGAGVGVACDARRRGGLRIRFEVVTAKVVFEEFAFRLCGCCTGSGGAMQRDVIASWERGGEGTWRSSNKGGGHAPRRPPRSETRSSPQPPARA